MQERDTSEVVIDHFQHIPRGPVLVKLNVDIHQTSIRTSKPHFQDLELEVWSVLDLMAFLVMWRKELNCRNSLDDLTETSSWNA